MFDSSPWLSYQPKQWQTSCVRCFIPSHCCWIGLTDLSKVCLGRRGFVDGLPSVPSSYSPDMYDRRRESAFLSAYLHSEQCLEKKVYWKISNEFFFGHLGSSSESPLFLFFSFLRLFWVSFESSLNLLCVVVESSYPSPFPCLLVSQSPGLPVYRSSAFSVSWSPCLTLSHSPGLLVSRHSVQV